MLLSENLLKWFHRGHNSVKGIGYIIHNVDKSTGKLVVVSDSKVKVGKVCLVISGFLTFTAIVQVIYESYHGMPLDHLLHSCFYLVAYCAAFCQQSTIISKRKNMSECFNHALDFERRHNGINWKPEDQTGALITKAFTLIALSPVLLDDISYALQVFAKPCSPSNFGNLLNPSCSPSIWGTMPQDWSPLTLKIGGLLARSVMGIVGFIFCSFNFPAFTLEKVFACLCCHCITNYIKWFLNKMQNLNVKRKGWQNDVAIFRQIQVITFEFNGYHQQHSAVCKLLQMIGFLVISAFAMIRLHDKLVLAQMIIYFMGIAETIIGIVLVYGTKAGVSVASEELMNEQAIRANIIENVERGNISKLLHSLEKYPRTRSDFKTYYEEVYSKDIPSWKFPVIQNLEEYLSLFSQCLIHITNSQNVDLQIQSTIPILIRHHVPAKITATPYYYQEILTWVPPRLNATGLPLTYSEFDCPFSKYSQDTTFFRGLCSSIIKSNFSFNIRPWNCEVIVALFPPLYMFEGRYFFPNEWRHQLPVYLLFPHVWKPSPVVDEYDNHFESNVFHIWIMDELYEQNWNMRNAIQWKKLIFAARSQLNALAYDTFTILKTRRLETHQRIFQLESNITTIIVPIFCKTIKDQDCESSKPNSHIVNEKSRHVAVSEVFQLIGDKIYNLYNLDIPPREYERLIWLWKNITILPNFGQLYKQVLDDVGPWPAAKHGYSTLRFTLYVRNFQRSLSKWQERHAFEVLKRCNKSAVILPALTCHQMARNLTDQEDLADVYVGEDVLFDRAFRIRVSGYASVKQIIKAKLMISSGIWDFWSQIFQHGAMFKVDKSSEKVATGVGVSYFMAPGQSFDRWCGAVWLVMTGYSNS
ncbi:unnamed protein product [Orchesella dallaii]|uniref:Uncharacterized protein n=1 Tax=Orchesella dallaii TaxID=48710 RepID=A0ABP1QCC5_9HEXA